MENEDESSHRENGIESPELIHIWNMYLSAHLEEHSSQLAMSQERFHRKQSHMLYNNYEACDSPCIYVTMVLKYYNKAEEFLSPTDVVVHDSIVHDLCSCTQLTHCQLHNCTHTQLCIMNNRQLLLVHLLYHSFYNFCTPSCKRKCSL